MTFLTIGLTAAALAATSIQDPTSRPAYKVHRSKATDEEKMSWTGVLDEASFAALHELKEGAAPDLRGTDVKIGQAIGYLTLPESGNVHGAVVVIHEWWGLNDHVKHWSDRLAADGYAALAIDLYQGTVATTRDDALAAMQAANSDSETALATLRAAHDFLRTDERVRAEKTACIGWCFGGGWSLKLAMAEPELDAAIIYYGRLNTDVEALATVAAPVMGVFGNRDRGIPPESVDAFEAAMKSAGKSIVTHRYEADHAFANPSSGRYDSENASDAWRNVRAFLAKHIAAPPEIKALSDRTHKLRYDLPEGWKLSKGSSMRLVSVRAGESCDGSVIALRGGGGGMAPNLNRWRQQLGQKPLSAQEIDALPTLPMLDGEAVKIMIKGNYTDMGGKSIEGATLLGVVLPRKGEVVFVKMVGPATEMKAESSRFDAFCKSLR